MVGDEAVMDLGVCVKNIQLLLITKKGIAPRILTEVSINYSLSEVFYSQS